MRQLFISCLFFVQASSIHVFSQTEKDSLYQLIRTMPEDTSKMDVYFSFGEWMEHENLDSASHYYGKAGKIADQFNHVKGKIKFISYYSYVLSMQGKLDEAYRWNREALGLARENKLGLETAKSLTNLANSHNLRGELDTAVQYYMEAAELFDKINNTRHLHILYMNIGVAFDALQQYERAIEYQRKSISYSRVANDSLTLIRAMINMGSSMNSLHIYDSAMTYLNYGITYTKRHGYTGEAHNALLNYANSLAQLKRNEEALDNFQESLNLAKRLDYPSGIANSMHGIAMVLFNQQKYQEANTYSSEAIRISENVDGVFADLRQQYKLAADIRSNLGQTSAAFRYLRKYVTLNDSLSGQDVKRITADLERKYQVAQKDKAIVEQQLKLQQAEADMQRKNTQLISAGVGLVLTLVILLLLYRFFGQRQRLQQQQVLSLRQEQEVIRLRSNLEGQQQERMRIAKEIHDDIGSGLTSLVFLTSSLPEGTDSTGVKERVTGIARQMVGQMNEIVWSLNSDQDSLEDLVIYIRHSISEMLETVGLEYEFRIPAAIPAVSVVGAQRRHIFLVIKEAVHNCIKHAEATKVILSMSFTDTISITIEDNGRGISGEKTTGNGLKNMQYRMQQVGGEWKLVSIEPVKIQLTVPLAQPV